MHSTPSQTCLLAAVWAAAWLSSGRAQADPRAEVDRILADPAVQRMHIGVCIADVAARKTLYNLRGEELFIPASNMKLLTTAAALDRLGAEFAFVTIFGRRGDDLLVLASGDPGLGDERLARRRNQPIDAPFQAVAAALRKAGVNRIAGDLVVDATVFDAEYFHPNWPADQRDQWYAAEVGGFNFNDNCVDIRLSPGTGGGPVAVELVPNTRYVQVVNKARTDPNKHLVAFRRQGLTNTIVASGQVQKRMFSPCSVPIHDPPAFAAQVLVETLAREGIALGGRVRFERLRRPDGSPPDGLVILVRHEQFLGELLWRCNTFSQNFIAEAIFKSLGACDGRSRWPTGTGSWQSGRQAVLAFVRKGNLPAPEGLVIDDGSGLSKANQVSPGLLVELLVRMANHSACELWFDSLPEPGGDGTLRRRFRGLNTGQMVLAKTGTLSNAVSLSGYVRTKAGKEYAFSILCDRLGDRFKARQVADRIVLALTESDRRPASEPAR